MKPSSTKELPKRTSKQGLAVPNAHFCPILRMLSRVFACLFVPVGGQDHGCPIQALLRWDTFNPFQPVSTPVVAPVS